ncbi:MAG: cell surface protein SprA [Saprospiraceae bacterium]|nr:cell surface protein SprA [Saprospiraceae bacterium]
MPQIEVFPNVQLQPTDLPNIQTLDMTFFPNERGPYNFDIPSGYPGISRGVTLLGDPNQPLVLNDPKTRWGGIMRALQNNDVQSSNIEFLEFWMLSPFLDENDPQNPAQNYQDKEGELYINLGNISEDILRDSRKFFENGLPAPTNPDRRVDETSWSRVPIGQQITRAFDNDPEARLLQDVGLDGLDNDAERSKFTDYIAQLSASNPNAAAIVAQDPANDDYRYYRDETFPTEAGVLRRYRDFNNPQGNSRENDGSQFVSSSTNIPDAEDLDRDNTLNETESYFQYRIPLKANPANPREIDVNQTPFITDRRESEDGRRVWYRFRIPLNTSNRTAVGGIRDFRSIRFMRMYMHGFQSQTTLRFATLELVRNQWRRYLQDLSEGQIGIDECENPAEFDVDAVNIEENSGRTPFNYVLPEGIQREQSLGVFNALQNEQSLSMVVRGLCDGEDKAIFKNLDFDMRVYQRLRMFVHAEALDGQKIENGEMSVFIRLGSDIKNNYYEYEIPLTMSDSTRLNGNPNSTDYKLEVWKPENNFDFAFEQLRQVKQDRNNQGFSLTQVFSDTTDQGHFIRVKGNPNIGYVRVAMVGVRNRVTYDNISHNAEVWINEMRLLGLDERGGVAAVARIDLQLADFGNITAAGNYSSIGFGALDQKVQQRSRNELFGYDLAGNFELGKFFPEKWGIRLPFLGQVSQQIKSPEYDPYDLDIPLKQKLENTETSTERDSIRELAQDVTTIKSFNFTNVRKDRTGGGGGGGGGQKKPMPWDIENFSVSYGYTETNRRDPIIEFDEQKRYTGGLDYAYSHDAKYIEPFKNLIKDDKYLKIFKEFNFNPLPNSFTFSTIMDRRFDRTRYRFTGLDDLNNTFFNKRFTWDRDYGLQWNLSKSLNLSFNALAASVIDEPDELWMLENVDRANIKQFRRDSIWNNIKDLGRMKNYRHNITVSYQLPIRLLPFMDWVQARASYQADYSWTAAALNVDSLGNIIQNNQTRQISVDLNFANLYNKFDYLKKIDRPAPATTPGATRTRPGAPPTRPEPADTTKRRRERAEGEPSTLEKILIRPLLLLRSARFNYTERLGTIIPGFTPKAELLGLGSGFDGPGWDFVAGLQPNIRNLREDQYGSSEDWLYQNRRWISGNVFLNQQVVQEYDQTIEARVTLEPFRDFRIDLDANKKYVETHSEYFKVLESGADFSHAIPQDIGSMNVSFYALNTLFSGGEKGIKELFNTFETNRIAVSQRIGTGQHIDPDLANQGYTDGYGRTQQDVLVPAFLAAYTDQDPNSIELDVFKTQPAPNWRVTYNGLSRLPLFQELFQNFSLTHGYKSTLTVNRFNTGLDYLRTRDQGGINELNGNFYPRLEIPEIAIQEGFQPLLAITATLKNGMSMNFDYKKSRTLAMSFVSNQLSETQVEEAVFGFGYRLQNVNIGFLTGSKNKRNQRNRNNEQQEQPQNQNTQTRPGGGGQLQNNDLDIQFNFSLRDDVTFNHLLDQGVVEPTRGSYQLRFSPSAEYKINRRLSLRLFFDYNRNVPKTSAGFPRTEASGGVVVRFQLQ